MTAMNGPPSRPGRHPLVVRAQASTGRVIGTRPCHQYQEIQPCLHASGNAAGAGEVQRRPNSASISARLSVSTVGRPVGAGGGAGRRLHLAQQRVHLGPDSTAARPARCRGRPGGRWRRRAWPSSAVASPHSANSSARSRSSGAGSGGPCALDKQGTGSARTNTAPGPNGSSSRPERQQRRLLCRSRRAASGRRQVHHRGQQQRPGYARRHHGVALPAPRASAARARRAGRPAPGCHPSATAIT